MKDLKALLAKLREKLGDAHKELLGELDEAAKEHVEALDAAKAEKVATDKKLTEAEKAKAAAEKAKKKAEDDLDGKTKGEGEETAKLRAERDKYKGEAEAAEKKAGDLHREFKLREVLVTKHGLTDPDAAKLFDTSGITLDTGGNLIGLDAVVAKWKEAKPYAFKATEGDGKTEGGAGGAGKLPNPADKKGAGGKDKTPTAAELARQSLERTGMLRTTDKGVSAPPNPLDRLLGRA